MKLKNLFITLGLSLAVGVGVGASLSVKAKETKAVELTEPAAGLTRLFLDMSLRNEAMTDGNNWTTGGASFKVHTWGSTPGDKYTDATKAADNYWYADVNLEGVAGYRFVRYNSDGSSTWNRGKWTSDLTVNYFVPSAWSGGGTGDAAGDSDGTWSKVNTSWSVKGTSSDESAINIALSPKYDSDGLQAYTTTLTLKAGDKIRAEDSEGNKLYSKVFETNALTTPYLTIDSENNNKDVVVVNGGVFEIYVKPYLGKIWIQVNSETEAITFSNAFLGTTYDICSAGGTSADHGSALAAIWNPKDEPDGTSMVEKWNALTSGAKSHFGSSDNGTIASARERYLLIMDRYSGVLTAFEGGPHNASSTVVNVAAQTNNTAILLVVIISATALVAVGGFFLLKKKREN